LRPDQFEFTLFKRTCLGRAAMDTLSPQERSERMSRVRSKDTKPELVVRRLVHRLGFRYRLHDRKLPGQPDMVFAGKKSVIFVHGCFWHRHKDCSLCRLPKSKLEFWKPKLEENRRRDSRNERKLRKEGWRVLVVWECEVADHEGLKSRILEFLNADIG
jgi:DNA mismatch endonuclease (patch repair protein)